MTKVVILAGGYGTRLSEETIAKPKPMIEIGDRPILWHIMKIYSHYGLNDFIICAGYKGYIIKEYFANFALHNSDVSVDLQRHEVVVIKSKMPPWKVYIADTGEGTMTGGRLKQIKHLVENDEYFCMTYGDGVADVDIPGSIAYHQQNGLDATMTIVRPSARFGSTVIEKNRIIRFEEKPQTEGGYINGGFFVLSPKVLDLIEGDQTVWEQEPLRTLANTGQLGAWFHHGFWQPMDTLREYNLLENLWQQHKAPWMLWHGQKQPC